MQKKITLLLLTFTSLTSFAGNDCSQKDNYLKHFHSDYYRSITLTLTKSFVLADDNQIVNLKAGDTLNIVDTNLKNKMLFVFDAIKGDTKEIVPNILFRANNAHEATLAELEVNSPFKVTCEMIPIEDHFSQLGRYTSEFGLRKKAKN